MFIEQRSPFLILMGETFVCLLFIVILCCIVGYGVISVSKAIYLFNK